ASSPAPGAASSLGDGSAGLGSAGAGWGRGSPSLGPPTTPVPDGGWQAAAARTSRAIAVGRARDIVLGRAP
ncbi:MAG: hypothetical protein PVJ64_12410, partial [Gemmatimonadales bacterium]